MLFAAPVLALEAPPLDPPARLDELVAPIALYPDPLLAQVLAAGFRVPPKQPEDRGIFGS